MQLHFNATGIPPQQPMEAVPEGWYPVIIKKAEGKASAKNPADGMLALEFEIYDGPHKGRMLFTNLNLWHTTSPQAVEIAQRELSAICHVTGKYVVNDTNELLNTPFQVKAAVVDGRNQIKGYKDAQGNDPGKTGGHAPQAPAMPPAAFPPAQPPQQQYAPPPPANPFPPAGGGAPAFGAPAAAPQYAPAAPPQFAPPAFGQGAPAPAAPVAAPVAGGWQPGAAAPAQAPWGAR